MTTQNEEKLMDLSCVLEEESVGRGGGFGYTVDLYFS